MVRSIVLVALAGCDQLAPALTEPTPARVEWSGPHDGVAVSAVDEVSLVPEGGEPLDALHIRVTFAARARALTADATTASLEVSGQPVAHALAASASAIALPIARIESGGTGTVDLFFPRPPVGAATAALAWSAATADGRQPLRAVIHLEAEAEAGKLAQAGGHWWFAPSDAWPSFRHRDGKVSTQPPASAVVHGADDIDQPCAQW